MKDNAVSRPEVMQRIQKEIETTEWVVTYKGLTRTIGEWAEDLGMSSLEFVEKTVGPLSPGGPKPSEIDITEAVEKLLKSKRKFFYNNRAFSKSELSAMCGCSPSEFGKRLSEGMSVSEAVDMGRYRRDIITVELERNGKMEAHTASEWCEILGLDRAVYDSRIRMGWDRAKALQTPVVKRERGGNISCMITYNGETHSIKKWCEIRGMSRGTFYQRLKSGMSEKEALRLEVHDYRLGGEITQKNKREEIRIEYLGLSRTLQQWAYITGFNYIVLRERYIKGMTPEEILTTPLHQRVSRSF